MVYPVPKFGIYDNNPNYLTLGANLGVKYQRMSVDNTAAPWTSNLAHAASLRAAGFGIQLTVSNGTGPSGPPADLNVYGSQIAAVIAAFTPELGINIQNEIDATESDTTGEFYADQGSPALTAAAYAPQLAKAITVANSMGCLCAGDAVSGGTLFMQYWYWLWTTGQRAAADAFAAVAFTHENRLGEYILTDIPSQANPNLGILANTPPQLRSLQVGQSMLPLYAGTGVARLNIHAYWNIPDVSPVLAALEWISQTTGMALTCNEMGQRDKDPRTAAGMIGIARKLGFPQAIWFCPTPGGTVLAQAQSPGDANGALYPWGYALRDAMFPPQAAISVSHSTRGIIPAVNSFGVNGAAISSLRQPPVNGALLLQAAPGKAVAGDVGANQAVSGQAYG